jgi:hypothetical protein
MRVYLGKLSTRVALAHQEWTPRKTDGALHLVWPRHAYREVERLWGVYIRGWFIGVQRTSRIPEAEK